MSSVPRRAPRILYVTHNGVGTPLVRSQVLPYLRGLVARGYAIDLITFERGAVRFPEGELPREAWHPRNARLASSLPAKALDLLVGVTAIARHALRRRPALIHARSYLPAAMAALAGILLRVPYVFDMRGFLGDEYVEGGHWRADDVRYRLLTLVEGWLLARASEVVVLTHVAAERLRDEPRFARALGRTPVTVIPCAVDLERFVPSSRRATTPTLVYAGSLGMWYALDEMLRLYLATRALVPDLRFLLLNRDEHQLVRSALARFEPGATDVRLEAVDFADMPAALAGAHVGLCLLRQARSKSGSSPIKVAEYLACGLPVVVNVGQGDTGALVERYEAGAVLADYGEDEMDRAARAAAALLTDEGARARARRLAETEYDVRTGVARYAEVYARAFGARSSGAVGRTRR